MSDKTYEQIAEELREAATPGRWRDGGLSHIGELWANGCCFGGTDGCGDTRHIAFMHNIEGEVRALYDRMVFEHADCHLDSEATAEGIPCRGCQVIDDLDARARELVGEEGAENE